MQAWPLRRIYIGPRDPFADGPNGIVCGKGGREMVWQFTSAAARAMKPARRVALGTLTLTEEEQAQIERDKESDRKRRQDKHFSQSGGKFLQHPYPEHRQRAS